jgi:hypothetical protein
MIRPRSVLETADNLTSDLFGQRLDIALRKPTQNFVGQSQEMFVLAQSVHPLFGTQAPKPLFGISISDLPSMWAASQ